MLEIFILLQIKGGVEWIITKRNVTWMFAITLEVSYFQMGWVAIYNWGAWGWVCSGSAFTVRRSHLPGIWWMAELYWSTHTPQLARMAPSSHPGHGDGHTLGDGIGLPAKLRVGSQMPSEKGYKIFPCSVFPEWTKPNPSTTVVVFQGYGALVSWKGQPSIQLIFNWLQKRPLLLLPPPPHQNR